MCTLGTHYYNNLIMKYYFVFFIVCLFISCVSNKKENEMLSLFPSDSLNAEIGAPTLIKKVNNRIFVNYSFSEHYFMDAIDVESDSILYSFAARGQGPNEFLQIASMDVFCIEGKWFLLLFDNMKRQCVTYSIDSLDCFKGHCNPVMKQDLPLSSRYLEVYKMNNFYLASGRTAKKFTMLSVDSLKCITSCVDYLVGNSKDMDSMTISKANYGRQYISADRKSLLGVVFMAGTLSLYEVNADTVAKKWEYISSEFKYKKVDTSIYQQSPVGYLAADFVGERILALYSGEEKGTGTNYGKEFHLLDNEGNLLRKYSISSELYNFCVDMKDSLVYAISYNPDPKIVIYDIRNL